MKSLLRVGLSALILALKLGDGAAATLESVKLVEAASRGDVREVKALLGMGVNPDEAGASGQTALGFATLLGHVEMIDLLCGAGANPNLPGSDGLNPLMMAVLASRYDLVVILLRYGADVNFVSDLSEAKEIPVSALSLAINRRDYDVVRLLISKGAKASLLVDFAAEAPNPLNLPVVEIPLDYRIWRGIYTLNDFANSPDWGAAAAAGDDRWALHRAARDHDFELLARSIGEGSAPDKLDAKGVSPLMIAAWHGNRSAVTLLLGSGANSAQRDVMGRDVLCYAAAGGDLAVVRRLLGVSGGDATGELDARAQLAPHTDERLANELEFLLEQYDESSAAAPLPPSMIEPEVAARSFEDHSEPEYLRITDEANGIGSLESSPLYYALATGNRLVLDMLLRANFTNLVEDEEGVDPLMMAAWLADLYAVKRLMPHYSSERSDLAGRTALAWSAAAFARDRLIARDFGHSELPARNYPVARFLSAHGRDQSLYDSEPVSEIPRSVIEAWNIGINLDDADYWRKLKPSPVPSIPGDGDRTLYQIFRDEEEGIPENN